MANEFPTEGQGAAEPSRQAVVIGIGNQKGGVGKTTTTVELARALVERGRKVLVIDLDVNAGATKHLGVDPRAYMGTFNVLVDDEDPLEISITSEDDETNLPPGLDLLPGSRKLEELEGRLRNKSSKFANLHDRLRPIIENLRSHYDYVLLDTPPSAPLPIVLAYMAADYFLLVAIPEGLAIDGLGEALDDITDAREHGNPKLEVLGVIMGMIDRRTRLSRELLAYVDKAFDKEQIHPHIQRSTIVPTAQTQGRSIFDTDPSHPVTEQFREIARVIEERVADRRGVATDAAIAPTRPATTPAAPAPAPIAQVTTNG